MTTNGKTKTLADLIKVNRDDQALDVIGGNGHSDFTGCGEFDESDPRSVSYMLRLNDSRWPRSRSGRKYLTFDELIAIKTNLLAALEHEPNPAVRQQIEQARRIVLAALGEMESEQ